MVADIGNRDSEIHFFPVLSQNHLARRKIPLFQTKNTDMTFFTFDFFIGTDAYNQASLCFVPSWDGSDGPTLRRKNPAIFRGSFVDYGLKSSFGLKWNPFEIAALGK